MMGPTPPETPEMCRAGPIIHTTYLKEVHHRCPGVYGYAYDDGMGLLRCTPRTVYDLTFFCPDDETNFAEVAAAKRKEAREKKEAAKKAAEKAAKLAKEKEEAKKEEAAKLAKEKEEAKKE